MQPINKADLHIHTTYSDGTASVPDVLTAVAQSDLRVIAITDHDTIQGALEARSLASEFGVEVIVGEEVSTQEGHLLALFVEDELPPYRPAAETIDAVHAQGGLCIAAHPYDWATSSLGYTWGRSHRLAAEVDHPWHTWRVDGLEVFNASLLWPRSACNLKAQHVAHTLGLPALGGSDAHSPATVGSGYTLFPGSTADDLYRAIKNKTVRWGGAGWSTRQVLELSWISVKQRSVRGALAWALADLLMLKG